MNYMDNKDCSEYAEDYIRDTGKGSLFTVMFFDNNTGSAVRFIRFNAITGVMEKYVYHTVVKQGSIIIDVTSDIVKTGERAFLQGIYVGNPQLGNTKCFTLKNRPPSLISNLREAKIRGYTELRSISNKFIQTSEFL